MYVCECIRMYTLSVQNNVCVCALHARCTYTWLFLCALMHGFIRFLSSRKSWLENP